MEPDEAMVMGTHERPEVRVERVDEDPDDSRNIAESTGDRPARKEDLRTFSRVLTALLMAVIAILSSMTLMAVNKLEDKVDFQQEQLDVMRDSQNDARWDHYSMNWKMDVLINEAIANHDDLEDLLTKHEAMNDTLNDNLYMLDSYNYTAIIEDIYLVLMDVRNDTSSISDYVYPNDYVDLWVANDNVTFRVHLYDNFWDVIMWTPYFNVANWTDFIDWIVDLGDGHFTQRQKSTFVLIAVNMAYFLETGTWLGE